MDRRTFMKVGAGFAAFAASRRAFAQDASSVPAPKPNVVFILSDDHGWGDYGFMGHPAIKTPNIDRLAGGSLQLRRAYVPTALCRPSLATIVTGLYAHQHGITGNDPGWAKRDPAARDEMVKRFEQSPRLPATLSAAGYRCFQAGKWWEGNPTSGGFTAGMTEGDPRRGGRHGDIGLKVGRETMQPVLDFIDGSAKDGKPFFLWYAPMMPHLPHNPPNRLLDKYTAAGRPPAVAAYYAMCEWFDETIGQLLDHLEARKLAENTIVVFLADNGWVQTDKPGGAFGGPRGKRTVYEGGTRTPMLVRWPARLKPRVDDTHLASSIDIAPTVLKACGLLPAKEMRGIDLLDAEALAKRERIFGEGFTHDVADLKDPARSLTARWCIEGKWKLIEPTGRTEAPRAASTAPAPSPAPSPAAAEVELYDILSDPHERTNLVARHGEVVKSLRARLEEWWAAK